MDLDRPGGFTVEEIKKKIAETHGIPPVSVSLFRDVRARWETEYLDLKEVVPYHLTDTEGLKIYWAFQGDSPSDWDNKRHEITPVIDHVLLSITEQLNNATFFLEKDFNWSDRLSKDEKKKEWLYINGLPAAVSQPALPIKVVVDEDRNGRYMTSRGELEEAYHKHNLSWRKTGDSIFESIRSLRTDKEQYHQNLKSLEENDSLLRHRIYEISGKLFPPFPDTALYTPLFNDQKKVETLFNDPTKIAGHPPDLIINSLIGSIEQNTIYYHQELGKYNLLKKEECQLIEKYLQIQTRMKLWIVRERIRLVAWELMYSKAYEDEDEILSDRDLRAIRETLPYPATAIPPKKRSFQCMDFCQCEAGCQYRLHHK